MHAVIRSYSGRGANELFDLLEDRRSEIDDLMRPIQGLVSYVLLRTADGGASVTVCQDKAGTDESLRIARQWIAANASDIGANAPVVSEGPVILHLSSQEAPAATASAIPLSSDI
jgi:hypothetical protein